MGNAFSAYERKVIEEKLQDVARECLGRYGVKRTTVDEIVRRVGISKGSFYNFYPQKEILFFTVLEDYQRTLLADVQHLLDKEQDLDIERYTEIIFNLFQRVRKSFLMPMIVKGELEYLVRRLPPKLLAGHHSFDKIFARKIFARAGGNEEMDLDILSASLRAIFVIILHNQEIGEAHVEDVMRLLIRGIVQQVMPGDSVNG
jgi:AcrR family transcriptional regulator